MANANPNVLLVEGVDDKFVVPYLMEANGVAWPSDRKLAPVWIENLNSIDAVLHRITFETFVKRPGLQAIGLIVDADADCPAVWSRVLNCCSGEFPGLSSTALPTGVLHTRADGLRLGVWVMPDNQSPGMMESLLVQLVKPAESHLLSYAEETCREASKRGASFKMPLHIDKARLHTFLAWYDPPGHQLHEAVYSNALDGTTAQAAPFVKWFRDLYQV